MFYTCRQLENFNLKLKLSRVHWNYILITFTSLFHSKRFIYVISSAFFALKSLFHEIKTDFDRAKTGNVLTLLIISFAVFVALETDVFSKRYVFFIVKTRLVLNLCGNQ